MALVSAAPYRLQTYIFPNNLPIWHEIALLSPDLANIDFDFVFNKSRQVVVGVQGTPSGELFIIETAVLYMHLVHSTTEPATLPVILQAREVIPFMTRWGKEVVRTFPKKVLRLTLG